MTLVLELTDAQKREIEADARHEGVSIEELALRRLTPHSVSVSKPYRAMQFAGAAPSGRTAAEIDAELSAMRDEWSEHDLARTEASPVTVKEAVR